MEHSQLSQMVTWLDKEHQRDRAQLAQLQQRLETLVQEREDQTRHVNELQAELSALRAHVERVAKVEDYFQRFKQEINALLERSEARRQQAIRDSDRVRQVEIDNVTQSIGEFRKELEKFRSYDEELISCRTDIQRLGESIARLQQQILDTNKGRDERVRSIMYLEEQRNQDNKRIAQLQAQTTELGKRIEAQVSRIQQLEQFPPRIGELRSSIDEVRQNQNKELERIQFQDAQRERQIKSWRQEAEVHRQRMEEFGQQIERYAEQYHRIKKATEELQEFEEQIQRRQHEMAELQRLAENRQRSEIEEWQVQEEQRWKKHMMEWEHQWSEYDRALAELSERIPVLEKQNQDNVSRLELLLRVAEEDAEMRAMATREWQKRFEDIAEQE